MYSLLISLRICTPFSAEDITASNSRYHGAGGDVGLTSIFISGGPSQGGRGGIGGSTRAEAERRRAMALKALDQRLHAASSKAQFAPSAVPATVNGGSSSLEDSTGLGETKFDNQS